MTDQHRNGRHDPEIESARLSAAWDDLVAGRPVEAEDADGLVRIARSLAAETTTVRGRPGYREQLRDTIMQLPSVTFPTRSFRPRIGSDTSPHRPAFIPSMPSLGRGAVRWAGLVATVALLLATAAGGYLATVGRSGGNSPGAHVAAPVSGTPVLGTAVSQTPTVVPPVEYGCGPEGAADPYTPCGATGPNIVAMTAVTGELDGADSAGTEVQMQRWQLAGNGEATFAAPTTPLTGIGMDIVINGSYAASFSEPVRVEDDQSSIRYLYTSVPANAVVELSTGDVVTYRLGTKREVWNPLESAVLNAKTILIYDGDPSPENISSSGPIQTTVDGEGTLAKPISAYGASGVNIVLTYSVLIPENPFPPLESRDAVILGPVDPVNGPVGGEGFVLWAFPAAG